MRKILTFSLAYLPYIGGAEIAIKEITDRLDPAEFEFHVVTLRFDSSWPKKEKIGNVVIHRIGAGKKNASVGTTFTPLFYVSKIFFIPLAALKGRELHKTETFDAVWAMMAYMVFPIVIMRFFGIRLPYVLTLQEGDTFERQFGRARLLLFMPLLDWGFRQANVVQAISHFLGEWARRRGFEGSLEIVPNGVDGKKFSAEISPDEKAALRRKYGFAASDKILLTISRLVPKNGVDLVIRALSNLPQSVKLLIVGDGPDRKDLQLLAQELGVADRVVFTGHIDNAELPRYLHTSDIFIRASRSEGQGIAFIEAMAAGIPVVAPQVGGISDFLFDAERNPEHEPTGFAIDPESPSSVVEVVQRLINDPLRASQVAHKAQQMVLKEYDWDKIAEEMRDRVFMQILK